MSAPVTRRYIKIGNVFTYHRVGDVSIMTILSCIQRESIGCDSVWFVLRND